MVLYNIRRWRGAAVAVAFSGSLVGCMSLASAPNLSSSEQKALSVNQKEKYVVYEECMANETDRFSHITSAPPSDIAWGAQAGCEDAYRNYQQAVTNQFTAFASGSGQAAARTQAEQYASETAKRIHNRAIQRVLMQRR